MGLPRINRLRSPKRIATVLKKGRSVNSPLFRVRFLKTKNKNDLSEGMVIISKKFDSSAVRRNLIRRRIIEGFRIYTLPLIPYGYICIFIPYESIRNASFDKLKKEMLHLSSLFSS